MDRFQHYLLGWVAVSVTRGQAAHCPAHMQTLWRRPDIAWSRSVLSWPGSRCEQGGSREQWFHCVRKIQNITDLGTVAALATAPGPVLEWSREPWPRSGSITGQPPGPHTCPGPASAAASFTNTFIIHPGHDSDRLVWSNILGSSYM